MFSQIPTQEGLSHHGVGTGASSLIKEKLGFGDGERMVDSVQESSVDEPEPMLLEDVVGCVLQAVAGFDHSLILVSDCLY
ncbi:hypothetical protein DY000_02033389 [Brassica cretica]|uniref:Uncharacterized protein n=1 Tax=Brassica cretica TaxID=69181 RepID=A0ABQ7DTU7_BRACR|nr:hypothetical protein DY000_02033389 [Brassica cretica]